MKTHQRASLLASLLVPLWVFLLVLAVLPAAAAGRSLSFLAFQTPSGNIMCAATSANDGYPAFLRCDMVSGLKPRPPRPAHCQFDYGQTLELSSTGRGLVGCVSDAVPNHSPALAYGKSWIHWGFSCKSRFNGLTCKNKHGHGFFLSRARWRVF